jgi:3-methyladenine DNA glycosylase AlkC
MQTKEEKFSLKDHLFNPEKIEKIATEIKQVYTDFEKDKFTHTVTEKFPELELKERIYHITDCLKKYLPNEYKLAVEVLLKSLPAPCDPNLNDDDFGDFIYAPYHHFVAVYGCTKEHLTFSLNVLEELTTRFSAEDAIRYFINAFPEETMRKMNKWAKHPHYHVRRLASEGSRPKLPWCQKISIPVEEPLSILEQLYSDSTRYVTRSVANHLNDISKVQPDLVIKTLKKWTKEQKQNPKEMDFIVRHALRTLIKKGNEQALELIGIKQNPDIEISLLQFPKEVKMNSHLLFEVELKAKENTTLLIDYALNFQNKKGEMNSRKMFKLKQINLSKNERIIISKKHFMKQFMTTRTLYSGKHQLEIQVNGEVRIRTTFALLN